MVIVEHSNSLLVMSPMRWKGGNLLTRKRRAPQTSSKKLRFKVVRIRQMHQQILWQNCLALVQQEVQHQHKQQQDKKKIKKPKKRVTKALLKNLRPNLNLNGCLPLRLARNNVRREKSKKKLQEEQGFLNSLMKMRRSSSKMITTTRLL